MNIKIYSYFPNPKTERHFIADFMKPFVKELPISKQQRETIYGNWTSTITFVENPKDADFGVLPFTWNYYVNGKHEPEALSFINLCREHNLKVISQVAGDFGFSPPTKDCLVLRQSGYASHQLPNHLGMPVFIRDPMKEYYPTQQILSCNKPEKPLIGFCGLAGGGFAKYTKEVLQVFIRNNLFTIGLLKDEPQEVVSSSKLRMHVLQRLQQNISIDCNFIVRSKYRAGVRNEDQRKASTIEFFDNIRNTDYTVCIRGGGNFSVRLYETLAMGRIPVFVNTDCVMPFSKLIDWKKHLVWVEMDELDNIAEKVIDFHAKHSAQSFGELQKANRKLWEDYLSMNGFWSKLIEQLISVS